MSLFTRRHVPIDGAEVRAWNLHVGDTHFDARGTYRRATSGDYFHPAEPSFIDDFEVRLEDDDEWKDPADVFGARESEAEAAFLDAMED